MAVDKDSAIKRYIYILHIQRPVVHVFSLFEF